MAESMMESTKPTTDPSFKGGLMSPKSKETFAELRRNPPAVAKQKIICDEDKFENAFLRCPICHEKFNMVERSPRLLPCHHTFCITCLMQYYQKEADYRRSMLTMSTSEATFAVSMICPTCSATFITTEVGLRQSMTDHRVVQLLDFIGHTDKQTVAFCASHATQPLNFFCEKCIKPICRDCTILDHKDCSAKQLVFDITGAIQKYTPALEKGIQDMEDEAKSLTEKREECEKVVTSCKQEDEGMVKDIKETFAKIRKALDDREKELVDMAESATGKGQSDVEAMIKTFQEKEKEVAELDKEIKQAMNEGKIQEMFKIYERVRNYKTEPALNKDDLISNKQTTSTFNGRDEKTLISKISNFGDISTSTNKDNGYSPRASVGNSYSSYPSSYLGSSRYAGSSYTSTYTPRSYRY